MVSFKKIKKLLPAVVKDVVLAPYTSFQIGGKAKYFFIARNTAELLLAAAAIKQLRLLFFNSRAWRGNQSSRQAQRGGFLILGGGSNVLVPDKGFNGLVIKIESCQITINDCSITADAGVALARLVGLAAKHGLSGFEWAVGIPGTLGGAIFGNAGSFGESMQNIVAKVDVLDLRDSKIKQYDAKKCRFAYRESVFKKNNHFIIVAATILLRRDDELAIGSKAGSKRKEFIAYKKNTQPLGLPSAGSIFKNPQTIAAGVLIDRCGLKGKKVGGAMISEKHANFIVNVKNAKAKDVKKLIKLVKTKVREKFKIDLQEEIRCL